MDSGGSGVIISFNYTALYLPPNGTKTVTRRDWKDRTLKSWQKAWDEGFMVVGGDPSISDLAEFVCDHVAGCRWLLALPKFLQE